LFVHNLIDKCNYGTTKRRRRKKKQFVSDALQAEKAFPRLFRFALLDKTLSVKKAEKTVPVI
jgi:hypothetical protein